MRWKCEWKVLKMLLDMKSTLKCIASMARPQQCCIRGSNSTGCHLWFIWIYKRNLAFMPRKQVLKTSWWRMNANVSAVTGTGLLCQRCGGWGELICNVWIWCGWNVPLLARYTGRLSVAKPGDCFVCWGSVWYSRRKDFIWRGFLPPM